MQIFDLKDPTAPKTDGHYFTCECTHEHGFGGTPDNGWESTISVEQGAFGVDVRNYDGLIALSDMRTGLWLFRMDGFKGWNGHDSACRTSRACRTTITARTARRKTARRRRDRVTA